MAEHASETWPEPDLVELRRRIDGLDAALLELVAERCDLVRRVQAFKRLRGLPVRSPARERAMFARARDIAQGLGLPADLAVAILDTAVRWCLQAAGAIDNRGGAGSERSASGAATPRSAPGG